MILEPNNETERIIQVIHSHGELMPKSIAKYTNLDLNVINEHLKTLKVYGIIEFKKVSLTEDVISILPKFNEVILAGGILPYIEKQGRISKLEKRIKDLQLHELEIKYEKLAKQFNEQSKYWQSGLRKDRWQYIHWIVTISLSIFSIFKYL